MIYFVRPVWLSSSNHAEEDPVAKQIVFIIAHSLFGAEMSAPEQRQTEVKGSPSVDEHLSPSCRPSDGMKLLRDGEEYQGRRKVTMND